MANYKDEDYTSGATTLPDYQNVRNVIFHQWEEFNNSVVHFRLSSQSDYLFYKNDVMRTYLRFFSQINDKTKLGTLNDKERKILILFNAKPILFNKTYATRVQDITRKLMTEYGIFNLENNTEDYL